MRYLLDTDTAVHILRHPRGAAANRFVATSPTLMAISIVTKAELLVGPNRKAAHAGELAKVQRILSHVKTLEFNDACAEEFGRIAAVLFDIGTPVDGMDVQIAATAKNHDLVVVTGNARDFGKIQGLKIENWIGDRHPPRPS